MMTLKIAKNPNPFVAVISGYTYYFFDAVLTQHHFECLLEDTYDARHQWFNIGLGLGLTTLSLNTLRDKYSKEEDRYREVLKEWIRQGATVKKLVHVLESDAVKQNQIAARLRLKYAKKHQKGGQTIKYLSNMSAI